MRRSINEELEKELDELLQIRLLAKENKDFAVADKMRYYLKKYWKINVIDTPSGCGYTEDDDA